MLNELCKKDKQWREIAFNICKDKQLADDITQEMYLRIHKYKPKKITKFLIIFILRNLFLDTKKKKTIEVSKENTDYIIELNRHLKQNKREHNFEPTDKEKEILEKFKTLSWVQQELIRESYDRSFRKIEETYPLINYGYAFREVKKGIQILNNGNKEETKINTDTKKDLEGIHQPQNIRLQRR